MALSKSERKQRIRRRIRKVSSGTTERPRLSVFRSNSAIYAQVIDDTEGKTLLSVSSRDENFAKQEGTKSEIATAVGKAVAEKCKEAGIEKVAFDRGGNLYHGRVKALAEGAREAGLNF
ncbi:LSU ribosomal protein L18P [Flavobacteriaceae bacterium MAR_2009_75]|uniref:50S ribosomal protein L18 n=1 Tax=Pseudozobellia sp. WGM2 TaxID=2787625 RepID=UPI000C2BBB68|nr:50S ribosomal protein L18 [Pseudozobellia sp. WGM2]PKA99062.1 LSU ribosomal protein L18P [Flavobacteriaceae bacterium MAR_2009_75]